MVTLAWCDYSRIFVSLLYSYFTLWSRKRGSKLHHIFLVNLLLAWIQSITQELIHANLSQDLLLQDCRNSRGQLETNKFQFLILPGLTRVISKVKTKICLLYPNSRLECQNYSRKISLRNQNLANKISNYHWCSRFLI